MVLPMLSPDGDSKDPDEKKKDDKAQKQQQQQQQTLPPFAGGGQGPPPALPGQGQAVTGTVLLNASDWTLNGYYCSAIYRVKLEYSW